MALKYYLSHKLLAKLKMSWNVGFFEHRLNSVFLNGTSFFNPKEWKQNNIRAKKNEKILRRNLKLVKNFLFYPKGFITSAQSLLNTGLQQSHQITNVACRTIDPNNQWRVSRKCYKHRGGQTVCGDICSGIVQRFFFFISGMETVHNTADQCRMKPGGVTCIKRNCVVA